MSRAYGRTLLLLYRYHRYYDNASYDHTILLPSLKYYDIATNYDIAAAWGNALWVAEVWQLLLALAEMPSRSYGLESPC